MIAEQEVADYWHKQVMAWRTSGLSLRPRQYCLAGGPLGAAGMKRRYLRPAQDTPAIYLYRQPVGIASSFLHHHIPCSNFFPK